MTTSVAVTGSTGRMGALVLHLIENSSDLALAAAIHRGGDLSELIGADVIVDFTTIETSRAVADFAIEHRIDLIVGTSGWTQQLIDEYSAKLQGSAFVVVPNFSVASALATQLSVQAARFFDSIEILEAHHAGKIDSPSGTAVRTAELVAAGHGAPLVPPFAEQPARGVTVEGIPVHSLRLAGMVAKQSVIFGGTGEYLTITHDTIDNSSYVAGLRAAIAFAPGHPGSTVGLAAIMGIA